MVSMIKRNCLYFLIIATVFVFAGCGRNEEASELVQAESTEQFEAEGTEVVDSAINSENFPELSEEAEAGFEEKPFEFNTSFDTVFVEADMKLSNSLGAAKISYTGYIDFIQNKQVVKTKTNGLSQLLATEYVTDLVSGQTKVTFSDGSMLEVPSGLDALDYKKELEALMLNETVKQISENTYEVSLSDEQRVGYEKLLSSSSEYTIGDKVKISVEDGYISEVEIEFFDKNDSASNNEAQIRFFDYDKPVDEEE